MLSYPFPVTEKICASGSVSRGEAHTATKPERRRPPALISLFILAEELARRGTPDAMLSYPFPVTKKSPLHCYR
jgi:hypothetical protein